MVSCTFVSQNCAHNGSWIDSESWSNAGSAIGYYYTAMIEFLTPSFTGTSKNIVFNLAMAQLNCSSLTLRYAICSSNVNKDSYCNTYGAVSDTNQLATGTVTLSDIGTTVTYHSISVDTVSLSGGNTYYFFLWSNSPNTTSASGVVIQPQGEYISSTENVNHTIAIYCGSSSYIYIDNGTSFDAYEIYIDNGTGWDLYIPYIDNGTDWDLYG